MMCPTRRPTITNIKNDTKHSCRFIQLVVRVAYYNAGEYIENNKNIIDKKPEF